MIALHYNVVLQVIRLAQTMLLWFKINQYNVAHIITLASYDVVRLLENIL